MKMSRSNAKKHFRNLFYGEGFDNGVITITMYFITNALHERLAVVLHIPGENTLTRFNNAINSNIVDASHDDILKCIGDNFFNGDIVLDSITNMFGYLSVKLNLKRIIADNYSDQEVNIVNNSTSYKNDVSYTIIPLDKLQPIEKCTISFTTSAIKTLNRENKDCIILVDQLSNKSLRYSVRKHGAYNSKQYVAQV